ncbi:MAG: glycosyl hydrolase [Akkermansiaceae bacterium]|nr:glycosyl hydrolase [Akkermansiaceae bacterium]
MKTFAVLKNATLALALAVSSATAEDLKSNFTSPPDTARPGVYWYFMDGNMDRDEMVADLEAMSAVGIGSVLFLEVNIGTPVGPVPFMSEPWQDNLVHAIKATERLGMEFILGTGPGWSGSGGSWVNPEDSMQHLVGSSTTVQGPAVFEKVLPVAGPHKPNRHSGMSGAHAAARNEWFRDVAVLAFPTPAGAIARFDNYDIKTLKDVRPYSSNKKAPTSVRAQADYPEPDLAKVINADRVIDLTSKMESDGTLRWDVPEGDWTIMRFVARSTGQTTRPAPRAGHGFECDKFNADAYRLHWDNYQGKLLKKLGPLTPGKGLTTIHLDSWEMSSQNWSAAFCEEFTKRRGYDPQPYYPAYMGMVVGSQEKTERFLWDMRKTSQELVLENHAGVIKGVAHEHGLKYSNEPYDMNPAGNIDLGSVADIPACEFWNPKNRIDSQYSCIEAVSIAHTMGRPQVNAEAFTTAGMTYLNYPGNMKNQTDWAFAMGINGIIFHTFQHQPLGKDVKPGMTMGPYGVQWHRNRTMWHLFPGYHDYLTRCSHLLRQGAAVADILYLTPEGAPHTFVAPESALAGSPRMKDKKGYTFDAVTPRILNMRAEVENGKIAFPEGTSYSVLVLPDVETMTPGALATITKLVKAGATVIGNPPRKSPSLVGFPVCDTEVQQLAAELWGAQPTSERRVGKGRILLNPEVQSATAQKLSLSDSGNWIWFNKGNPAQDAAAGDVHFRYSWDVGDVRSLKAAAVTATADNSFTLKINGKQVLAGDAWQNIQQTQVLSMLRNGTNTIDVVANNGATNSRNPAGFIAALQLTQADGTSRVIGSDPAWQASLDGTTWSAAKQLGSGTMGPWGLKGAQSKNGKPGLYPKYAVMAAVLSEMGITEDFISDGSIRYGHRRTETEEIYFVANTSANKLETTCKFRVQNGVPELWDPMTAEMKPLQAFTHQDKITSIPMTFEAYQSFFVIFPRGDAEKSSASSGGANFVDAVPVATLEGSWEVAFDPKWGGPEKIQFDALQDWTTHSDKGIRYYSGSATYRKTFDRPVGLGTDAKVYLDLGTVRDICRVRLNGQDLGILWAAPWRVDMTKVLKAEGNQLEIEVVNRWVNRLVGDQQPEDKNVRTLKWESGLLSGRSYKAGRYTYTTKNPYKSGTKLLPSGLIGPVRILGVQK